MVLFISLDIVNWEKNIRYFKISRIQKLDILDDKFSINNTYDIKSILRTSFGIIDDEIFYLKLKISYPMSELVKEKQYSIEQKNNRVGQGYNYIWGKTKRVPRG